MTPPAMELPRRVVLSMAARGYISMIRLPPALALGEGGCGFATAVAATFLLVCGSSGKDQDLVYSPPTMVRQL